MSRVSGSKASQRWASAARSASYWSFLPMSLRISFRLFSISERTESGVKRRSTDALVLFLELVLDLLDLLVDVGAELLDLLLEELVFLLDDELLALLLALVLAQLLQTLLELLHLF